MSTSLLAGAENQLIASLPRADRLSLLAVCENVDLVLAEVLVPNGAPVEYGEPLFRLEST